MADPRTVYVKELSSLYRGRPVLNPRRVKFRTRHGLRPPIDVGDVVYDCEGQLIRLFNCLKPAAEQDEDCVFPDGYETLSTLDHSDDRRVEIIVGTRLAQTKLYRSKRVTLIAVEASASVSESLPIAKITFTATPKQGAVLATSGGIMTRYSPNRLSFERYMLKHFAKWRSLLLSEQPNVKPKDLMFITAVDYTDAWSNLVYVDSQLQGDFTLDAPSIFTLGEQSTGSDYPLMQSARRDSGPDPEDVEPGVDATDGAHTERACTAIQDVKSVTVRPAFDQVVFVRGLRARSRLLSGLKVSKTIEGAGFTVAELGSLDDDNKSVLSSLVGSIGESWAFC